MLRWDSKTKVLTKTSHKVPVSESKIVVKVVGLIKQKKAEL